MLRVFVDAPDHDRTAVTMEEIRNLRKTPFPIFKVDGIEKAFSL
jgi:hypothetical protein